MACSLTYVLKQHSPLIHYQGYQSGAFLSDAALKAAIDDKMGNELIGSRKKTIYSLYSELTGQIIRREYKQVMDRNTLYFGDQGKDTKSLFVFTKEPIKLCISDYRSVKTNPKEEVFNESLFEESLKYALAMNNFGKRGTKGFGSFWLKDGICLEDYLRKPGVLPEGFSVFKLKVNLSRMNPPIINNTDCWTLYQQCYDLIDTYYKRLKSGINFPERNDPRRSIIYAKSLLQGYVSNKLGSTWDKKHLKDYILNETTPSNLKMYRFMLGFAQGHEYRRKTHSAHGYGEHGNFNINFKIVHKESLRESDIMRIPSPINFKIVQKNLNEADILFFVNPCVQSEEYERLRYVDIAAHAQYKGNKDLLLALGDFDLNDFLRYSIDKIDSDIICPNPGFFLKKRLEYIRNNLVELPKTEKKVL